MIPQTGETRGQVRPPPIFPFPPLLFNYKTFNCATRLFNDRKEGIAPHPGFVIKTRKIVEKSYLIWFLFLRKLLCLKPVQSSSKIRMRRYIQERRPRNPLVVEFVVQYKLKSRQYQPTSNKLERFCIL